MKTDDKKARKRASRSRVAQVWPLEKGNYQLFALGLVTLVIGYILLSIGPWDSFWSRTLAPIVLVLGYCVILPLAILYRKKEDSGDKGQAT